MEKVARLSVLLFYILSSCFFRTSSALASPPVQQAPLKSFIDGADTAAIDVTIPHNPHEFGIGFDLTGSYGTAAVVYADGSKVDIAKIEAEQAYKKLLAHWSLESSQHPAPPYRNTADLLKDIPRQRLRTQRKAQGLPASEDVETLSVMLKALRAAAESYLEQNISSALAATPNLVALYQEDVDDAFEYIGLKSLDDPNPLFRMFHESAAAAASYGIGLCQNYTDEDNCDDETRNLPLRTLLSVLYTKDSLCVELSIIKSVYANWPYRSSPPAMDFSLGSDKIHDNPNKEHYWEAMKDTIYRGVLAGLRLRRRPSVIFVFGESSKDPKFRSILEDALRRLLGEVPEILDEDPVFRTAHGAAELAKRGGYI